MNAVVLGGTKGIGRAVARALAARGDRVFLLGRDARELEASAADLRARSGKNDSVAGVASCDLERLESFAPALDAAAAALGRVDAVIVTAGLFAPQARLEADAALLRRVLDVDFTATVLFCEEARRRLLAQPGAGTLCVLSSVAGERGRKPVVYYGAAKAGLSRYLESLDHKYRGAGLRTVCVKPGFVKTGMTEGLKPPPFAGEPDLVARDILRGLDAGKPVIYTPRMWALVMLVIRWLPRFVMRKIAF